MEKTIIRKWYEKLDFPGSFDREFEAALNTISIPGTVSIGSYDLSCQDGRRNLLAFLYMCEAVERKYRQLGIGEEILTDTLRDIVRWTENWSEVKGEMCLFELPWLARIMGAKLFKVGRLQFYMAPARMDIPSYSIRKGDNVVELHIPRGERLNPEAVADSLNRGRAFLERYFPEYEYSCFTCHSWLLDETLKKYLPADSNILRFGDLFDRVGAEPSNVLIRFLFRWDADVKNLPQQVCRTGFQRTIQDAVLRGETFHLTSGVIRK